MRRWWILAVAIFSGCPTRLGAARITVRLDASDPTRCLKASARTGQGVVTPGQPNTIARDAMQTEFTVGLTESDSLNGTVQVTVRRFTDEACVLGELSSLSKPVTFEHGKILELDFDFRTAVIDGGVDAGCDWASCPAGECDGPRKEGTCCGYLSATEGTLCGDAGVCKDSQCLPECSVPSTTDCRGGLACETNKRCVGGACTGDCLNTPPPCQVRAAACASATECLTQADLLQNDTSCPGGFCSAGDCLPWFSSDLPRDYLRVKRSEVPAGAGAWAIGGSSSCEVTIDTDAPAAPSSSCATLPIVTLVDDAGVRLFAMQSLSVGPTGVLRFVGSRPVELLVLGQANVEGLITLSPGDAGVPAGANPGDCDAGLLSLEPQGAGGGAMGRHGGAGGNSGGVGGAGFDFATGQMPPVLRGGCPGGTSLSGLAGGSGGGALAVYALGGINVEGVVTAAGAGGAGTSLPGQGAGGGGSGGLLAFVAPSFRLGDAGLLLTNGGNGGVGASDGVAIDGLPGRDDAPIAPEAQSGDGGASAGLGGAGASLAAGGVGEGGPGGDGDAGAGGGGSAGIIHVHVLNDCSVLGAQSGVLTAVSTCN